MGFCMNCGTEIPDGAKFCPVCGTKIDKPLPDSKEDSNNDSSFFNPYNQYATQQNKATHKKSHKGIIICIIVLVAAVVVVLMLLKNRSEKSAMKHITFDNQSDISSDYDGSDQGTDTDEGYEESDEEDSESDEEDDDFTLKSSDDKHIQYVDKYVGMNASTVGYTSLGGDRMISLGEGLLTVNYVTEDGSYVGVGTEEDEENLKDYVVTAQNIEPNTEVKISFEKDSDGEEYSSLTDFQSYDHIDLAVKKVGEKGDGPELTKIKAAPDKTKSYIRNYVGKNAASVGYISLGGDYRDEYGDGNVELKLVPDDGSAVDISDSDTAIKNLKKYVITSQSVKPNTALKFTYDKDVDGLVESQNIESITLKLKKIA